jgi:hypothetical protein
MREGWDDGKWKEGRAGSTSACFRCGEVTKESEAS